MSAPIQRIHDRQLKRLPPQRTTPPDEATPLTLLGFTDTQLEERAEDLLFHLLDNPQIWRERAVEQIAITSEILSDRERTIDVRSFAEVRSSSNEEGYIKPEAIEIGNLVKSLTVSDPKNIVTPPDGRFAELLLPIASLPRTPLLAFEIKVDGRTSQRLPRDINGDLQARYFAHLSKRAECDINISELLLRLLSCIFSFSSSTWTDFERRHRRLRSRLIRFFKGTIEDYDPVYEYIQLRQDDHKKIDVATYARWRKVSETIRDLVVRQHVTENARSAPENPLLAIPKLCRRIPDLQDDQITAALLDLRDLLLYAQGRFQADPRDLQSPAYKLVSTYASYGRRWEAVAKCRIPVDRSFEISVKDRRMMDFCSPEGHSAFSEWIQKKRSVAHYHVSFADAASNHLHITIPDQHVQLRPKKCQARNDLWKPLCPKVSGSPDDEQKEGESYSRYDTKKRVDQIWIELHLRQIWARSLATLGVTGATLSALILLIHSGRERSRVTRRHSCDEVGGLSASPVW
ncbi:hypothetical protein ACF9IK_32640 [Kitasatospora hibisci]|uniref:hypothetical protein n=1 Tax=Kitasatospora hibisci TaxID=3369522 RepID=UPI003753F579